MPNRTSTELARTPDCCAVCSITVEPVAAHTAKRHEPVSEHQNLRRYLQQHSDRESERTAEIGIHDAYLRFDLVGTIPPRLDQSVIIGKACRLNDSDFAFATRKN